jgi:hypothetical protein
VQECHIGGRNMLKHAETMSSQLIAALPVGICER